MKKISILGSTGSIGTQSIEVIKEQNYSVVGLGAYSNIELLETQARELKPKIVCIFKEDLYETLKNNLSDTNIKVVTSMEGLCEVATIKEADIVINSVVGMIGLTPTIAALDAKKDVALANKETLVTGGEIVMNKAAENGVNIYPIDSEHSAIFQAMQGNKKSQVKKIILTASGGPFFGKNKEELKKVDLAQTLKHPNWNMGKKITVDSATLMNKGLELIEACWLFNKKPSDVEIIVHKQSIIHSLVEFNDNSVMAQLGCPDMKIPIQYSLTYPERLDCDVKRLSLTDVATLTFEKPDPETFICLKACYEAIERGGLYPTIVNGANEKAVELFLEEKISFINIGEVVYKALEIQLDNNKISVENIAKADLKAREFVLDYFKL
jgi:1-deoxy-D-xylulose-5-phosphate reductoisomerase